MYKFSTIVGELCPVIQDGVQKNHSQGLKAASKLQLSNFSQGGIVHVAREDFHANDKPFLCRFRPPRIIKAMNDYVYQV